MDWTWSMDTLVRALGKTPSGRLPEIAITSVRLTPAACGPGALYLPVKGFPQASEEAEAIAQAAKNGASAAFTNLLDLRVHLPIPVLYAGPTRDVLTALARHARSDYRGTVVGITGSVGKTSTKDLTHHVLSAAGLAHKTPSNSNRTAGICTTLINQPLAGRFTILEIAGSRPGQLIAAEIPKPHVGIITNVGVSHLQNFNSPRDLLREKISLLDHLVGDRIGIVHRSVLDADDASDRLIRAKDLSRLIVVGDTSNDDVYLTDATFDGIATEGTMSVLGRRHRFRLNLPARHFANTAMFAMAVAGALGLDIERLIPRLATAPISPRRFQRYRVALPGGSIELIDDAYNAAPASVGALLDSLGQRRAGRKVLVLGDMLALGSDSVQFHQGILPLISGAGVDLLVTVGDLARQAVPDGIEAVQFADAVSAAAALPALLRPNDIVAVKGSHDVGLGAVVNAVLRIGSASHAGAWRIDVDDAAAAATARGTTAAPPPSRMLVDPLNRRILFEEHGNVLRAPASLTKLMLLYIVFSAIAAGRLRLNDTFRMTIAGAQSRGSRLGCAPGTILTVEQAVTALAVASANDVAVALAESLAGSVQAAVAIMNNAARTLELGATRFATPHGRDAPAQVTSARDMARLATRMYLDFTDRQRFFGLRTFDFQGATIVNRNTLLPAYPGMNGMKTGTTARRDVI